MRTWQASLWWASGLQSQHPLKACPGVRDKRIGPSMGTRGNRVLLPLPELSRLWRILALTHWFSLASPPPLPRCSPQRLQKYARLLVPESRVCKCIPLRSTLSPLQCLHCTCPLYYRYCRQKWPLAVSEMRGPVAPISRPPNHETTGPEYARTWNVQSGSACWAAVCFSRLILGLLLGRSRSKI